jgi:hypothetical protein
VYCGGGDELRCGKGIGTGRGKGEVGFRMGGVKGRMGSFLLRIFIKRHGGGLCVVLGEVDGGD